MKMQWKWIGGGIAALLLSTAVLAQQTLAPSSLTGNETWEAASGPAGQGFFITSNQVRNSQSILLNANVVGTVNLTRETADYIITAQPASALTITLPSNPGDGQIFEVVNGTTSAFATQVITIQPSGTQTLVGGNVTATTLAAKASLEFRYVVSTNSWYELR